MTVAEMHGSAQEHGVWLFCCNRNVRRCNGEMVHRGLLQHASGDMLMHMRPLICHGLMSNLREIGKKGKMTRGYLDIKMTYGGVNKRKWIIEV